MDIDQLNRSSHKVMIYHILNGDSLANTFPEANFKGTVLVMREALIDGDLSANDSESFWQSRAKFHGASEADYQDKVVREFEKIMNAPDDTQFNLWFEYDLFCQVNMWFIISLLNNLPINKAVYAVYTTHLDKDDELFWNGFGRANGEQLQDCYNNRILLTNDDLQFGQDLWTLYKSGDLEELARLASKQTQAFPYIQEVIQAHIDRFPSDGSIGRPEKAIEDITRNISTDFQIVCKEFWKREGIYGFGDTQLKPLYDKVMGWR